MTPIEKPTARSARRRTHSTAPFLLGAPLLLAALASSRLDAQAPATPPAPDGRELFRREWLPGDPRSHGGDGLGPVFNDTSCVACHNQGGAGGAGPNAKNVKLLTAFAVANAKDKATTPLFIRALFMGELELRIVRREPSEGERRKATREQRRRLALVHPGFRTARSVVVHHFGVDDGYLAWKARRFFPKPGMFDTPTVSIVDGTRALSAEAWERLTVLGAEAFSGRDGFAPDSAVAHADGFPLLKSDRNPIALFGSGRIDSIPDEAIAAAAAAKHPEFPEVSGRVARTKDARIGRFGWKAQKAALEDFVRTACAVELGLHVPGESQARMPHKPEYRAPGLDLDGDELTALTRFVAGLPVPRERAAANPVEAEILAGGKAAFTRAGCAACHLPALGPVDGIYSDLLLHDLGPQLGDSGVYGLVAPDVAEEGFLDEPLPSLTESGSAFSFISAPHLQVSAEEKKGPPPPGATRQEWRTPPLWGLRDSAPYLHDGRAPTLEHAIVLHDGEAARSTRSFCLLSAEERFQLLTFLRSLEAPEGRT
jgi:CxxC motif-containing protein (DUF1111 family)